MALPNGILLGMLIRRMHWEYSELWFFQMWWLQPSLYSESLGWYGKQVPYLVPLMALLTPLHWEGCYQGWVCRL